MDNPLSMGGANDKKSDLREWVGAHSFFFLFFFCCCCKWTILWQFGSGRSAHPPTTARTPINKQRRKQTKQAKRKQTTKQRKKGKATHATQCYNKTTSPITKRERDYTAKTNERSRKDTIKNPEDTPMSAVVFVVVGKSRLSIPPSLFSLVHCMLPKSLILSLFLS